MIKETHVFGDDAREFLIERRDWVYKTGPAGGKKEPFFTQVQKDFAVESIRRPQHVNSSLGSKPTGSDSISFLAMVNVSHFLQLCCWNSPSSSEEGSEGTKFKGCVNVAEAKH